LNSQQSGTSGFPKQNQKHKERCSSDSVENSHFSRQNGLRSLKGLNIVIAGLGLMGGALADAFRQLEPHSLIAYDQNEEVLEQALSDGVIDEGFSDERIAPALSRADLVCVCLYPRLTADFICHYMPVFKPGVVITDIAGIKKPVIEAVSQTLREDVDYIPGHPMAGSEKEGYGGADRRIFVDRNYILVPLQSNSTASLDFLKRLIRKIGFTNIVETTAENHDSKIAFTSELCHVIASALIDGEDDLQITDYEGGSFADLTRIAMINASMWSQIFCENKEALVEKIDGFMNSMNNLRDLINDENTEELEQVLAAVRKKRIKMEIDRINKHSKTEQQEQEEQE
jgi:prephenate dehydrogenase